MQASAPNGRGFHLYVLECSDGSWYTGYAADVEERLKAHNAGGGAKYTRSRRPLRLIAQAAFATKHEAMSAEYRFKRLTRKQKEALLARAALGSFEDALRPILGRASGEPLDGKGVS